MGLKFPVPSEYDPDLLDAIIRHRFLEGPGSLEVTLGNYELFHARDSSQVISPQSRLLPGTSIIMAILFERTELSDQECPMPRCRSNRTTAGPGGGRIWYAHSIHVVDVNRFELTRYAAVNVAFSSISRTRSSRVFRISWMSSASRATK